MGGVFMYKYGKRLWSVVFVLFMFCMGMLLADRISLQKDLIRLHVVANSDTQEDQQRKLIVRDAIITYLSDCLSETESASAALGQIDANLLKIEQIARSALSSVGDKSSVDVSLGKESFPVREYDTFSLPSGVYQSLRVEIGEGAGENWWCVVFPAFCVPDSIETFCDVAEKSGMNNQLTNALTGQEKYKIRFFLLDCLGKLENILFGD